jgi:hypothetical protein
MQKPLFILTIIIFISCGRTEKDNNLLSTETPQQAVSQKADKVDNALKFINSYVENLNNADPLILTDWMDSNNLTTKDFKVELKNIVDEAYKKDPEIGLGFDPIIDAQDYPDKGFELESFDEKTNYLTVKGIDWPEFKLTLKIIEENGNWLVDGCGIINIPNDKRAAR